MTFGLKGDQAVYVWVSETVSNPCSTLDVRAEVLGLIGKCRGSYIPYSTVYFSYNLIMIYYGSYYKFYNQHILGTFS